jgi:hypothetical protein
MPAYKLNLKLEQHRWLSRQPVMLTCTMLLGGLIQQTDFLTVTKIGPFPVRAGTAILAWSPGQLDSDNLEWFSLMPPIPKLHTTTSCFTQV